MLAALAAGPIFADAGSTAGAPTYSADSVVNSASGVPYFAPNTFISIYGQNLSRITRAITNDDIAGGVLPTALGGAGVRVLINHLLADLWYVSPTLVNVLVPTTIVSGPAILQLEMDGLAGPPIAITLGVTAPALWQLDATTVLGVHLDATVINTASPARAGELIVLFATGLGPTVPAQIPNTVAQTAAEIAAKKDFQILLNGAPIDPSKIQYCGAAPGTAGVYQINVTLPADAPKNPEIRIAVADRMSPAGRILPVQ